MTVLNKYTEAKKKRAELKAEMNAIGRDVVRAAADEIFAANPSVSTLTWRQFTPYFNDGDACYFSVRTWQSNEDEGNASEDLVDSLVNQFEEDDLEEWFGDHAKVIVTRDNIEVETYDHD